MRTTQRVWTVSVIVAVLLVLALLFVFWEGSLLPHPLHTHDEGRLYEELSLLANDDLPVAFDNRLRADLLTALSAERAESRALAQQCLEDIYWKDRDFCQLILEKVEKADPELRLGLLTALRRAYPSQGFMEPAIEKRLRHQFDLCFQTESGWSKSGPSFLDMMVDWLKTPASDLAWDTLIRASTSASLVQKRSGIIHLINVFWRKDCSQFSIEAESQLAQLEDRDAHPEVRELLNSHFHPLRKLRREEVGH